MRDGRRGPHGLLLLLLCLLPGLSLTHRALVAADADAENRIDKERFARASKINHFDFEADGNKFQSQDFDGNGWPDYWLKLIDDQNKAYLANDIRIVEDPTRPGRQPGGPGHVLQIPFDGTGVALRTRVPVEVNPDMAYEVTMWVRSLRLERSRISLTLRWINYDVDGAENVLGESVLTVPPGQLDWPETPLRLRVNSIPPKTTHVVLLLSIYRDPDLVQTDRDGLAWIDDITISARPKIFMVPTFRDYAPGGPDDPGPQPLDFDIQYRGLVENVPEGEREGQAKSYYRIIEISDIFGNPPLDEDGKPIALTLESRKAIIPGTLTSFPERLNINLRRLGVYYLSVTLYGHRGVRLAERTQVLGLWLPPLRRKLGIDEAAASGGFGVVIESIPETALQKDGALADLVERTGAQYVKSILWPGKSGHPGSANDAAMAALNREFIRMRRSGVRITGLLDPPQTLIGSQSLHDVMRMRPSNLAPFSDRVAREFDTQIENWQWGGDRERSFAGGINKDELADGLKLLAGKTSSPAQSFAVPLDADGVRLPPADTAYAGTMFVPGKMQPMKMLQRLIQLLPQNFSIFRQPERRLYPPLWLYDLAPQPEIVDETRTPARRLEEWGSIGLLPAVAEGHNPQLERMMLDDMAKKLVLARVSGLPRTYIAPLIDPAAGLARIDAEGNPVPTPALLGLRVLSEYLNGASYLGSFVLRNQYGDFPNFVFSKAGGKDAFCVVWLENDKLDEAPLDFGGGYRLSLVDMQGNIRPLQANTRFVATRTPQIVAGMSVPFARTRMSIRILPAPPLRMFAIAQRQYLTITNFYEQSISGEVSMLYAAREDFEREPNWDVQPPKARFDIGRPRKEEPREFLAEYMVRPPDSSPVDPGKEFGEKLVSLRVTLMADRPQILRLIRSTDLTGDIRLTLRRLTNPDDRNVDIIQMKVRWIPERGVPHKNEILLRPFFRKGSELQTLLPSVSVPAYQPGDEETPPVPIEFRIPREPRSNAVWIGYHQEDGTRFFNYNASHLVGSMVE